MSMWWFLWTGCFWICGSGSLCGFIRFGRICLGAGFCCGGLLLLWIKHECRSIGLFWIARMRTLIFSCHLVFSSSSCWNSIPWSLYIICCTLQYSFINFLQKNLRISLGDSQYSFQHIQHILNFRILIQQILKPNQHLLNHQFQPIIIKPTSNIQFLITIIISQNIRINLISHMNKYIIIFIYFATLPMPSHLVS